MAIKDYQIDISRIPSQNIPSNSKQAEDILKKLRGELPKFTGDFSDIERRLFDRFKRYSKHPTTK